MPPLIKIKKEDIIEAGYLIVKEEGLEALNARRIAKKLKCSIQPIFSNFKTMEELKKSIMEKIWETYQNYIIEGTKDNNQYKGMGRGYIKFAKEQPKLFQILFMNNHNLNSDNFLPEDFLSSFVLKCGREATKLTGEEMKKFHFRIWVFTHGIATLLATNTCDFTDEEIDDMLKDAFFGVLNNMKEKNNESNNKSN